MATSEPGVDSPLALRDKKAALNEVIELQRRLIEQREGSGGDNATNTSTSSDDEELRWYAEQTKRLEKFKHALNALRLQPDEFQLLVPAAWASGGGGGGAAREYARCALRVNARSQLTFVAHAVASSEPSATASPPATPLRPRVFFVDQLRNVRAEAAAEGRQAVSLEWKPPHARAAVRCTCSEGDELAEVLGAHLRRCVAAPFGAIRRAQFAARNSDALRHSPRYNQSRVATVARLKEAHALKATAYSSADASHERLLRRLWNCGFPGVEMSERVTEQWLRIGFQGADPATDFRGMGVLGLQNLVYFGEHYPEVFQRLVSKQRKRDYPLACAGINVTAMLVDLLRLRDCDGGEVAARPPFESAWESDMFAFFCHMFYRERPFEDMYCFALRTLDRVWVSMDADYADFPSVIAALKARLQEALAQRPLSFREFKRLVAKADRGDAASEASGGGGGSASGHSAASTDATVEAEASADRELSRVIAEAMGALPRGLESAKARLGASLRELSSPFGQLLVSPPPAALQSSDDSAFSSDPSPART